MKVSKMFMERLSLLRQGLAHVVAGIRCQAG
jgi:hypothetical protein